MALRGAALLAVVSCLLGAASCLSLDSAKSDTAGKDGGGGVDGGIFPGGSGGSGGSSAGSGGASSDAAGDNNLYSFDPGAKTWSKVPLGSVWHENNAPPLTGIVAATHLSAFDRLLVFTADGNYYRQFDGVWQPPLPVAQAFPMIAGMGTGLGSACHTPTPAAAGGTEELVTFTANPMSITYRYHSNDVTEVLGWVTMDDNTVSNAPLLDTGHSLFDFETLDSSEMIYYGYDDGHLYQLDSLGDWTTWPYEQTPYFLPGTGAPDPKTIAAAWTDAATRIIHCVAP